MVRNEFIEVRRGQIMDRPDNGQPENLVKRLQWQKPLEEYDQENNVI